MSVKRKEFQIKEVLLYKKNVISMKSTDETVLIVFSALRREDW